MKLNIEPSGATRASYAQFDAMNETSCVSVLPFAMERQLLSHWCWAAIASSMQTYYDKGTGGQECVASLVLDKDCSLMLRGASGLEEINRDAMLDHALKAVHCFSHWSPEKPAFERIVIEIDAARPLCVCLEWKHGGNHYAVIVGYSSDTRELYLQDPLHEASVQPYDAFPGEYRSEGAYWRGTYWTAEQAGDSVSAIKGSDK